MTDTMKPTEATPTTDVRKVSVGSYNGNEEVPVPRTTRSQSLTTSALPSHILLPPELQHQWVRRRESLEKLQLDKVAPWMHLYDFSESESDGQHSGANSP